MKRVDRLSYCAIIPAYNEEARIGAVVKSVLRYCPALVVDDGSSDCTAIVAAQAGATALIHLQNMGVGAAIRTGMEWVERRYDCAVILGADGQHHSRDWGIYARVHQFYKITASQIPENAVVVTNKPAIYYLITGHKSFRHPYTKDITEVKRAIAGVNYVILDVTGRSDYLFPAIEGWPVCAALPDKAYLVCRPAPRPQNARIGP